MKRKLIILMCILVIMAMAGCVKQKEEDNTTVPSEEVTTSTEVPVDTFDGAVLPGDTPDGAVLPEDTFDGVVRSEENSRSRVTMINRGEFTAKFTLECDKAGSQWTDESRLLSKGEVDQILIPEDATSVQIEAFVLLAENTWMSVFSESWDKPVVLACEIVGGLNDIRVNKLSEDPPLNGEEPTEAPPFNPVEEKAGKITIKNEGGYVAKYTVTYTYNGEQVTKESGSFTAGFSRSIDIPAGAYDISLHAYDAWFFNSWNVIFSKHFNEPETRKYKVTGTTLNTSYEELQP